MLFEVFQARVDNLLHAKHFGSEEVAGIVDAAVELEEAGFHVAAEVVQTLIIYENTDEHGEGGECGCGKRSHELIGDDHSVGLDDNRMATGLLSANETHEESGRSVDACSGRVRAGDVSCSGAGG
jgi:hypothetical protein